MSSVAIQIRNLRVWQGGKTVLAIDDAAIRYGEIVAIMGPNGAGKSTFLRVCLGLQGQIEGEASVLGQTLNRLGMFQLTRLRRFIGYVPQHLPTRSELPLTVREVVAIGRTGRRGLFRSLQKLDWKLVDDWIERLGVAPLAKRGFAEISGGEQRKVMIARAMVQEPELLLLDEPTANLDLGWRERIVETVQSLYQQTGLTVVLVCHELEVLPPCCQRVLLLDRGRLLASGTPEKVFTDCQVSSLYGAGFAILHQGGRHVIIPQSRI